MVVYPCVTFVLPFCIHIPNGSYDVMFDCLQYRFIHRFIVSGKTSHSPMTSNGPWELQHDYFGRMGNSKFTIVFPEAIKKPVLGAITKPASEIEMQDHRELNEWKKNELEFINTAIKVSNRILEVYRDQDIDYKGDPAFHILPVTIHDISDTRVLLLDDEDSVVIEGGIRPYPSGSMSLSGRPEEVVYRIKAYFGSGKPVPVWRILIRSAQNALWRWDYRLVPIEANTSFEVVVDEILNRMCKPILNLSLLDKIIRLQQYSNDIRGSLGLVKLNWAPEDNRKGYNAFLDETLNPDVVSNWYKYCYRLRNKVVHEGFVDVNQADAKHSIMAAEEAIEFLHRLTNE